MTNYYRCLYQSAINQRLSGGCKVTTLNMLTGVWGELKGLHFKILSQFPSDPLGASKIQPLSDA